jgi:sulfur carrier protein ThiS
MTIPQHPFRSQWQPIKVDVVGYRLIDTIETAALEALHNFCNQHPMEDAGHPIGLFPAIDSSDPEWNFRIAHYDHMLEDSAEETLRGTIRFMNVQHQYQILLCRGMGQLIGIAQGHYRNANRQVTLIEELQALVTEKEEIIAEREETIIHWEDQIKESDAIITQRNMIIEFLQEQIHDLILEVDDAHAHIDELQQQPVPPAIPEAPEVEEEDPEEIEGVFDLDSEHGNPEPNPQSDHSSSDSQSSVGDLNDF